MKKILSIINENHDLKGVAMIGVGAAAKAVAYALAVATPVSTAIGIITVTTGIAGLCEMVKGVEKEVQRLCNND